MNTAFDNKQPAPLGGYRNPFDFLRDVDRQEKEKRAELERTGRLTDEAAREIAEAYRSQRAQAETNHRERVRRIAWDLTPAGSTTLDEMGSAFLANKGGHISLLACVSLIVAEVTAKDFPADIPFWPDDDEFAAAVTQTHREALQIIKDAIRTNTLPVRRARGLPRPRNQEADVIAWCDDTAAARPPAGLCVARADVRGVFMALDLQPPPQLFASHEEWLAATESAQAETAQRSAMTQTVIERLTELHHLSAEAKSSAGTETKKKRSRNDFVADVLDEALDAVQGDDPKALWRWIITNIESWPEIEFDAGKNELRVGTKAIDVDAFEARVRRRRKG